MSLLGHKFHSLKIEILLDSPRLALPKAETDLTS